jgi:hypothetical protein
MFILKNAKLNSTVQLKEWILLYVKILIKIVFSLWILYKDKIFHF